MSKGLACAWERLTRASMSARKCYDRNELSGTEAVRLARARKQSVGRWMSALGSEHYSGIGVKGGQCLLHEQCQQSRTEVWAACQSISQWKEAVLSSDGVVVSRKPNASDGDMRESGQRAAVGFIRAISGLACRTSHRSDTSGCCPLWPARLCHGLCRR